eukprot:1464789-Amphidinium_carterae.5
MDASSHTKWRYNKEQMRRGTRMALHADATLSQLRFYACVCILVSPLFSTVQELRESCIFISARAAVAQDLPERKVFGQTWTFLGKAGTTQESLTVNPFLTRSGNGAATETWIWLWISAQGHFPNQWWLATSAIALAVPRSLWDSASAVATVGVQHTLLPLRAWMASTRCAAITPIWSSDLGLTSSTSRCTGTECPGYRACPHGTRQDNRLDTSTHLATTSCLIARDTGKFFSRMAYSMSAVGVLAAPCVQALS